MIIRSWLTALVLLGLCQFSREGLLKFLGGKSFFKKVKSLSKCEVVWENMNHPHCETTWNRVCEPTTRTECQTEYVEKCRVETERKCKTEEREQCETKYIDMCESEAVEHCVDTVERQCEKEWVEECWQEDDKECSTTKECGTQLNKVCSTIKKWVCDKPAAEPEPEPEPSYHRVDQVQQVQGSRGKTLRTDSLKKVVKRAIEAKETVKNVEEEMMQRFESLSLREMMELTDSMTEEDFEDPEDDGDLHHELVRRQKRASLGHIAGAVGISALYKKFLSTQDECRQVDVPHCAEVPVESCWDVRKCKNIQVPRCQKVPRERCWDEPAQDCWTEPKQTCWQEPKEKCWSVPEEQCWEEPRNHCWEEPQENCFQVSDEKCKDVPSEKCEDVNVRVAKRKCDKDDKKKY